MLAESMGWDPTQNAGGPFDFLHKIGDGELSKLLANEDPGHIAFIAAYWEPEEMSQVLATLTDVRRKETILQIARLRSLPQEIVQQAALRFAERLKALRSRNEVDVDGSDVVAKMLGNVDSNTEEELLKFIEREDPATRDRLRSRYFSFDSLTLLPQDLVAAVVEAMDPSDVTKALAGSADAVIEAVLAVLPPKQRAIVEDDVKIASTQNTIPKQETSVARKNMVVELRKAMKERGIELSQLGSGGADNVGYTDTNHYSAPPIADAPTHELTQADAAMPMAVDTGTSQIETAAPMILESPEEPVATAEGDSVISVDPNSDDQAA